MANEKKPYIIDGKHVTLEEYRKTKYEDLRIRVPKGKKEIIKKHADSIGQSVNTFVNIAIDEKMTRGKKTWYNLNYVLYYKKEGSQRSGYPLNRTSVLQCNSRHY